MRNIKLTIEYDGKEFNRMAVTRKLSLEKRVY